MLSQSPRQASITGPVRSQQAPASDTPYSHSSRVVKQTSHVDYKTDASVKPPMSYATLITEAITQAPGGKITLANIYAYIRDNYAYFRVGDPSGWQVCCWPV